MDLKERMNLLVAAENDVEFRALFVQMCNKDAAFWINTCCWTFDPRFEGHKRYLPFLLFPRQEAYVKELEEAIDGGYDLLTEKSRDTGETWVKLAVILKYWIFDQGFTCLLGSIKEEKVEKKGDPSAMFWKLDFLLKNQPDWLKPNGYADRQPTRTFMKMLNPMNGSVITGESSNPDFGRSGRYKCIFPDEFASWENAQPAWTSCQESTKCRLPGSTPKGMNFFGRLANPQEGATPIRKFRLHWTDDPRHNKRVFDPRKKKWTNAWYEEQEERYQYDPTMLAQELDIDYNRSMRGRVYPQIDFVKTGRFGRVPNWPLYCSWDFGRTDGTAIIWFQRNLQKGRYEVIDCVYQVGMTIDFFVAFITGVVPSGKPYAYTPPEIETIKRHDGWEVTEHYGDPAGKQRNQVTDTSVIDELAAVSTRGAENGIYIRTNEKAREFKTRYHAARMLLRRTDVDNVRCSGFLDAMRDARFAQKGEGTQAVSTDADPIHDWTSHYRTSFEYMAVNDPHLRDRVSDETDLEQAEQKLMRGDDDDDDENESYLDTPRGPAGY